MLSMNSDIYTTDLAPWSALMKSILISKFEEDRDNGVSFEVVKKAYNSNNSDLSLYCDFARLPYIFLELFWKLPKGRKLYERFHHNTNLNESRFCYNGRRNTELRDYEY